MTFDYELTLITVTSSENEIGDSIKNEVNTIVLCDVQSITRSEFYSAAMHGLRPEMVFVVNKFEYNGQKEVEFDGKRYNVIRHYAPKTSKNIGDFETIELVCQGLVGE